MELLRDKIKKDVYTNSAIQDMFRRGELRKDHPQQRKPEQWNNQTRDGFIATVIKHEDVNPIIICEQLTKTGVTLWVIDGLQRLTYLHKYKNNGFKLGKFVEMPIISYQITKTDEKGNFLLDKEGNLIYENIAYDLRGKGYNDLPEQLKAKFDNYQIDIVKHLDCTDEEIGYHIRRYNRQTSMNTAQDSITYMDNVARYVKRVSAYNNRFFKDCGAYTEKERNKGTTDRIVIESVMCMFHLDNWHKQSKKLGAFLNDHSSEAEFQQLNNNLKRLEKIYQDDFKDIFTAKDSFIWFTLFDRFTRLRLDDRKFAQFLIEFKNNLFQKRVGKESFYEIDEKRSTKDKAVIMKKLNLLEALMEEYLHVKKEEAVKEAAEELAFLKENVNVHITQEDMEFYQDILGDLTLHVDNNSKLLDKRNRPSVLAVIGYACEADMDPDEWFVYFFERNTEYMEDQKQNFLYMKRSLIEFL